MQQEMVTKKHVLEASVLLLFSNQTGFEKRIRKTVVANGYGFNRVDSPVMTSFARYIIRRYKKNGESLGKCLTNGQYHVALRKMPKYAEQIIDINAGKRGADRDWWRLLEIDRTKLRIASSPSYDQHVT